MSFVSFYYNNLDAINYINNILNAELSSLRISYPKLIFANAAGNESRNRCDSPIINYEGNTVIEWPTLPNPDIIPVGSVNSNDSIVSSFSNYGSCVEVYSYGGPNCLKNLTSYKTMFGTSFSSPLFVATMLIIWSRLIDEGSSIADSSDQVFSYLKSNFKTSESIVALNTEEASGGSPTGGNGQEAIGTNNTVVIIIIVVVVILLFLVGLSYRYRKIIF